MPIANVEIISKETIKPSLPTPNHPSVHKLCVLDQLIPAEEAPIVIFYPNNNGSSHLKIFERLASLKNSMSETLTRYYPLAGSIKEGDLSIECNDRGARFITAEVKHMSLDEFLRNPNLKFIDRFLPTKGLNGDGSHYLTNVQANVFACGGIAIAVCITHRVLDGTALSVFLKSWAAANNSDCDKTQISPDFSASSLFPPGDLKIKEASMKMWLSLFKKGRFVTQRFVFESSAISKLKDMAKGDDMNNPTRVESVSAFISKCFLDSLQGNPRSENPSLVTHVVNLRKRASPNFPESSLGNLIWMASSKHYSNKAEESLELSHLSGEIRRSVSKIEGDYVKKLMSDEGKNTMIKYLKEIEGIGASGANQLGFTSWCKLGFYDVDFGWGRPSWVSSIDVNAPFFMNLVVLMDTRYGDGIEAWVTMDEQDIARLESNQEFMKIASCNPSPLRISK